MKALLFVGLSLLLFTAVSGWKHYDRDDDDDDDRDDCDLPKEEGDCREHSKRYHYSKKHGMCRGFYFKGCKHNKNNFRSREDCYNKCGKHCGRKPDEEVMDHTFTFRMDSPFSFYEKNKAEYDKKVIEAVCEVVPVSSNEVTVNKAWAGSTYLMITVNRSFETEDKFKKLTETITNGQFTITVAGTSVTSIAQQDVKQDLRMNHHMRKKRCRMIIAIVAGCVVLIGVLIAIIAIVKYMKKKQLRAAPLDTAKKAFESVCSHNNQSSITKEKMDLPPAYEAAVPNEYCTPPPLEENYPTKNPDEVPA